MDFNSCSELACSEIRAATVSECSNIRFKWTRDYCIRTKAEKSTQVFCCYFKINNIIKLNCQDAKKLVAQNFRACSQDIHPIRSDKR